MENALVVNHLYQGFGDRKTLVDVSFSIPKGKVCAFIGANGAGKTTTIKSIVGLWPYTDGKITINGIDAKNKNSRLKLGYVPEKENFPKENATTFVKEYAKYYEITEGQIEQMIERMSKLFEIENLGNCKLTNLSSGQKKKILIIQALIHNPDLLIMDEPTENMDPNARNNFYKIIKMFINNKKTVFISTHQLDEIQKYANYIVIIEQGRILFSGDLDSKHNLYTIYEKYISKSNQISKTEITTKTNVKNLYKIKHEQKKNVTEQTNNAMVNKKNKLLSLFKEGILTKEEYEKAIKRLNG